MREFVDGMRMAWRRPLASIAGGLLLTVPLVIFASAFYDLNIQLQVLHAGLSLREHNAVVFNRVDAIPDVGDGMGASRDERSEEGRTRQSLSALVPMLKDGTAYSAASLSGFVDQQQRLGDAYQVVIVSGTRLFNEIRPDIALPSDPCAMLGSNVDVGSMQKLTIGTLEFPIVGRVPSGCVWFEAFWYPFSLDDVILLSVRPDDVGKLDSDTIDEMVTESVFVNAERHNLAKIMRAAPNEFSMYLIPEFVASMQAEAMSETMTIAAMFMTVSCGLVGLLAVCLGAVEWRLLRGRMGEFALRAVYGATRGHRFMRVLGFASAHLTLIPSLALVALAIPDTPVRMPALMELAVVVTVGVTVSAGFSRTIGTSRLLAED